MTDAAADSDALARRVFDRLAVDTADPPGVTRDTYGPGENAAHALVLAEAEALGLEVRVDAVGNLFATLAGADRSAPATLIGSHLDSVPHGGNYDGAAGVVAGLMLCADLIADGVTPFTDITVCAFRGEESWFPTSYIGSNAALGLFPPADLAVRRDDTGRTLADHMAACGFDPGVIERGEATLAHGRVGRYLEVHIEQGPALIGAGVPVGVVTAINGGVRFNAACAHGSWDHSGATPRRFRNDAALAVADMAHALEAHWDALDAAGKQATITFTNIRTDPALMGASKVSGRVDFALDVRSAHAEVLDGIDGVLDAAVAAIKERRGVLVDMGPAHAWPVAALDSRLIESFTHAAEAAGVPTLTLPSGAGHDAAVFAEAGIPAGMLFVRNAHGSHNADEAMEIEDLAAAVLVLKRAILHPVP
jgi:N-carbamoyl-L-amino-acid hydrolase